MTVDLASPRRPVGVALFSHGFRPFFLSAAVWAVASICLWAGSISGGWTLPAGVAPLGWHNGEMVFGYTGAVIAGFLLTAVPNWTGRAPLVGWPLAGLWGLWVLGRIAGLLPAVIGPAAVLLVDSLFLFGLAALAWREVVAAGNERNLPVCLLVTVFAAANLLAHVERLSDGVADYGPRLGLAVTLLLIALIGGRIVPNFTGNVLIRRGVKALPAPFGPFDRLCLAITALALLVWVVWPHGLAAGIAFGLAGLANLLRLRRWRGLRVADTALLLVLHVGYFWLAAGFCLMALERLLPGGLGLAALHALTAGAIGTMTLAVMTRATLGHTGRALAAGPATTLIYGLVTLGALLRVLSPSLPMSYASAITVASICWAGAFLLFALIYGPMMLRRRIDDVAG